MHFVLFYEFVPDFLARRGACRDRHLEQMWDAHARGDLLLAGALADPADMAVIVFNCDSAATVEAFAREDIYTTDGLVTKWWVRPWNTVVGDLATNPTYPG